MTSEVRPLAGVRVIDLTQALAGPYTTMMLADAGADVIKVERPGGGDVARGWGPPFVAGPEDTRPESAYFMSINRGKRSVELDLRDETSRAVLLAAIEEADVLCENFRPGAMARLGLDPELLQERNPRLVGASISAFGDGGPEGQRPGFDQILQGESGLMSVTGQDAASMVKFGVPIADMLAGIFSAHGILLALIDRETTGRGTWVNTSLFESMLAVHAMQGARWLIGGEVPKPEGNKHPTIAPYSSFECSDGPLNLAIGSESLWQTFAPLVGLEPEDSRFATNADRVANSIALDELINLRLADGTVDEWFEIFVAAGLPVGRIRTIDSVYSMAQVAHLDIVRTLSHSTVGSIKVTGPPLRFADRRFGGDSAPPALGEHNDTMFRWRDTGNDDSS